MAASRGASVEIEHDWTSSSESDSRVSTIDSDTYVAATLTVEEKDSSDNTLNTHTRSGGSIGGQGSLKITFTAASSTTHLDLTFKVEAQLGQEKEYYTKVTMDNYGTNASVDWTNQQDFIGSDGAIWRDYNSNTVLKMDGTDVYSSDSNPGYNDARIEARGGAIIIKDKSGTEMIRIHSQGYIDFKQTVSNGGDIPQPGSGWVRITSESNNSKMARKAGDGSAGDF